MQVARCKGTVVWFDGCRGHGFIGREEGADVFVHFSQILTPEARRRQLTVGDLVEFDMGEVLGRIQATNVRKVGHVTQGEWRQHG